MRNGLSSVVSLLPLLFLANADGSCFVASLLVFVEGHVDVKGIGRLLIHKSR